MFDTRYEDSEGNYLWNGHEYKFTVEEVLYTGTYKKFRHAFFDSETGNKICGVEQAANIQNTAPLKISVGRDLGFDSVGKLNVEQ